MRKDRGVTRISDAIEYTNNMKDYFDSIQVGDVVGVNSMVTGVLDETACAENNRIRNKIRGRVMDAKLKTAGKRTAVVVAKTQYLITVEYVPMHPTYFSSSKLTEPWRESFS